MWFADYYAEVAKKQALIFDFTKTLQAQKNNNQSQIKLLIVVAVITSAF